MRVLVVDGGWLSIIDRPWSTIITVERAFMHREPTPNGEMPKEWLKTVKNSTIYDPLLSRSRAEVAEWARAWERVGGRKRPFCDFGAGSGHWWVVSCRVIDRFESFFRHFPVRCGHPVLHAGRTPFLSGNFSPSLTLQLVASERCSPPRTCRRRIIQRTAPGGRCSTGSRALRTPNDKRPPSVGPVTPRTPSGRSWSRASGEEPISVADGAGKGRVKGAKERTPKG